MIALIKQLNLLMAKEITGGVFFKCSLFYGLAVLWNVSLFPQNKQLTGLHNSVLEDRRAQLILTSMQEGQGHM